MPGENLISLTDNYSHSDLVLSFIPMAFVMAYSVGTVFDALTITITAATVLCYFAMADGLFWHTPVE